MPVVQTTAYGTAEDILLKARAFCNDMAISGGDVLTDDAPFSLQFVNQAYEDIQLYLAENGVKISQTETWLTGVPANATGDPESRVIISDSGTEIFTPSGAGESSYATPVLPDDLVLPLEMRERPTGTTIQSAPMKRRNDGLPHGYMQGTYAGFWDWRDDTILLLGATAVQDMWLRYERQLAPLVLVTDTVPIRGVNSVAGYRTAFLFQKSRGGAMANDWGAQGQQQLDQYVNRSRRADQRINQRRRPYSGRRRSRRGW